MMTLTSSPATINGVTLTGHHVPRQASVLSADALGFLAVLHAEFEPRRRALLRDREERRGRIARGTDPALLPGTAWIRDNDAWRVPPPPPGLEDRRVEITASAGREAAAAALDSGAQVWTADLEGAGAPDWTGVVTGQLNLKDAIDGSLRCAAPDGRRRGPRREAARHGPTIVVRPRGWHLEEQHLSVRGEPLAGALVDFGLYAFTNAHRLRSLGRGAYFSLPQLESHREARLWHDVFTRAEELLGVRRGSIRATAVIETITAAFEMEEILWELGEHAAGLALGPEGYVFSVIKNFGDRGPRFLLPDRRAVTATQPFLRSWTEQLVRACHSRQAMAVGAAAALAPDHGGADPGRTASAQVRADAQREAADGFDGSSVASPDLVPVCREAFDAVLGERPHQLHRRREDVAPDGRALLDVASTDGRITEQGIREDIGTGIRCLETWLRGNGAAAGRRSAEGAATAELCRAQIWQWVNARALTEDGEEVTRDRVGLLVAEEFARFERSADDRLDEARSLFEEVALGERFPQFLTGAAYDRFLAGPEDPRGSESPRGPEESTSPARSATGSPVVVRATAPGAGARVAVPA